MEMYLFCQKEINCQRINLRHDGLNIEIDFNSRLFFQIVCIKS